MSDTPHLNLPMIEPSQAQKHVTHNEALMRLDAVVQLSVQNRTLTEPPASPVDGDRHIVNTGATGDWTGKDGQIAHFLDGIWSFLDPEAGWLAWVASEGGFVAWTGTAWEVVETGASATAQYEQLGVNTTPDAANRLAIKSNAILYSAIDVADGGDGDIRFKVNKETTADTASLLFQDNWSGRAEIGLSGDDAFRVKVSDDGANWLDGMHIDPTTGGLTAPGGIVTSAVNAGPLAGARNLIINGAMRVNQRAAILTSDAGYTVDRFEARKNASCAWTVERHTQAPVGFSHALRAKITTASAIGTNGYAAIVQRIEGFDVQQLALGTANAATVTFSFWVRSSVPGNYAAAFANADEDRSLAQGFSISAADTWEHKSVTVALDGAGNWDTGNGTGLEVRLVLAAGSGVQTSPGAWAAADNYGVSGMSNTLVNTSQATFFTTGWQLETGDIATPFERSAIASELIQCGRYYWRLATSDYASNGTEILLGIGASGVIAYFNLPFSRVMRSTPAMIVSNAASFAVHGGSSTQNTNSLSLRSAAESQCLLKAMVSSSFGSGGDRCYLERSGGDGLLEFDAEL